MNILLRSLLIVSSALALLLSGPAASWAKLKVVCTTTDLASITKSVAGDLAEVVSITSGKEDPHFIQAKPSYIIAARNADLWIRVGMELEVGWEPPLLEGARNPRILEGTKGHLDASLDALRLEVPTARVTRAMGDVHPQGNPHYWLDPLNGRIVAGTIAKRLSILDPANAETFAANLKAFRLRLDQAMFGPALVKQVGGARLWAWLIKSELAGQLSEMGLGSKPGGWTGTMLALQGQSLVTFHKSWVYFCARFGLKIVAELEPKPGVPPSGTHLKKVAALIKKKHVRLILQEPIYPTKAAELIAAQTGAKLVVVTNSVGGDAQAKDYLSLIGLIVNRVSTALR